MNGQRGSFSSRFGASIAPSSFLRLAGGLKEVLTVEDHPEESSVSSFGLLGSVAERRRRERRGRQLLLPALVFLKSFRGED